MDIEARLERIESLLESLIHRQLTKEYYEVDELAKLIGKSAYTVREWCRLGRLQAEKRQSGRGAYQTWVISHTEFLRYQREGLRPWRGSTQQ